MLSILQPVEKPDLHVLTECVKGYTSQALIPEALSDGLLVSLAKELRLLERATQGNSDKEGHLAAPLFLAIHLHLIRSRENGKAITKISLTDRQMDHSLEVLQFALEREIVTRTVDVRDTECDRELLLAFDRIVSPV